MAANDRVLYRKKGSGWTGFGSCPAATNYGYVPYASGIRKGDMLIICTVWRNPSISSTILLSTPSGWNAPTNGYFVAGVGSSNGWNTGTVCGSMVYRIADGTESGNVDLFWNGTVEDPSANMYVYSKPPDSEWETPICSDTYDVTPNTPVHGWSTTRYVPGDTFTIGSKDMMVAFSAINSYHNAPASDWTTPKVMGTTYPYMFDTNYEIDEIANGGCYGDCMVVSNHHTYYSTTTDSFFYTMSQNSPYWYGSTYPAGFTILMQLKFTSWPRLLRTYHNSAWKRAVVKHWNGSLWLTCDNGVSSGKICKKYNGSSWEKVSTLYLDPVPSTYDINAAAQTLTTTLNTGNHVQVVTTDSFITFDSFDGVPPTTVTRYNGTELLNIHVAENTDSSSRSGTIRLRVDEGNGVFNDYGYIYINQGASFIYLDYTHVIFDSMGNPVLGSGYITVTSSGSWTSYWQYDTGYFWTDESSGPSGSLTMSIGCNQSYPPTTYNDTWVVQCGSVTAYCEFIQNP